MRSALLVLIILGFFSFHSAVSAQMNAVAGEETVTPATVLFPDTEIQLESASGQTIPVQVHVVRALKIIPVAGEDRVGLRACGVSGCLPEHGVLVADDRAVVKIDLELTNTLAPTTDSQGGNAIFSSGKARFNVDGTIMAPVLELKAMANGRISEQGVNFYIEPQQKVQQTLFMRVPRESQSVILMYGNNTNQPGSAMQVCFSSCLKEQTSSEKNVGAMVTPDTVATPVGGSSCTVNGKSVPCEEVAEKVGAFAKMGLSVIAGLIIFGILSTVFWVMMLVHAATHPIEHKAIWILGMIFFSVFVSIAYYFAVKRPSDAAEKSVIPPVVPGPSNTPVSSAPPTQRM